MKENEFATWLRRKDLGEKTCKDVISRCKRVEKVLNVSLDGITSEMKLVKLRLRLREEAPRYLKPGAKLKPGWTALAHAARLYAEYKGAT